MENILKETLVTKLVQFAMDYAYHKGFSDSVNGKTYIDSDELGEELKEELNNEYGVYLNL